MRQTTMVIGLIRKKKQSKITNRTVIHVAWVWFTIGIIFLIGAWVSRYPMMLPPPFSSLINFHILWFIVFAVPYILLIILYYSELRVGIKPKRRIAVGIVILMVLLSSFTSIGWAWYAYKTPEIHYIYTIEIMPSAEGDYVLNLPLPINKDGTVSKIVEELRIEEGYGTYKVVNTSYGKSLRVSSNIPVILKASGNERLDIKIENNKPVTSLSMVNNSGHYYGSGFIECWVHCDMSPEVENITIRINLHVWYDPGDHGSGRDIDAEGNVVQGWQLIPGRIRIKME